MFFHSSAHTKSVYDPQALLHTDVPKSICFCIETVANCTQMLVHRNALTHGVYTPHLHTGAFGSLHTNVFTHRRNVIPHGSCCAQKCLHTKSSTGVLSYSKLIRTKFVHAQLPVHTNAFTNNFLLAISFAQTDSFAHTCLYSQVLVHTVTQKRFCPHKFFTRKSFIPNTRMFLHAKLLHADRHSVFTHRSFYTEVPSRTEAFKQKLSHKIALTRRELLHTEAFRQIICYTFTLSFSAPMLQKIVILHFIFGRWTCVSCGKGEARTPGQSERAFPAESVSYASINCADA